MRMPATLPVLWQGSRLNLMSGVRTLRAFVALGLAGAMLLLLTTPLCAAEVCPMGKARTVACKPLESDCCQTHGERTASSSLQVMPTTPLVSPFGSAVTAAAERALPDSFLEEIAPPAILQNVGLHTFLAVFLI
jgi:hypothetical protein